MFFYFSASKKINPILLPWALFIGKYAVFLLSENKDEDMAQPLAERLCPKTLDDYIGQKHLVGPGAVLRKMIDADASPPLSSGASGGGEDHAGADHSQQAGNSFLYTERGHLRCEGCARCDEKARSNRFFCRPAPSCSLMKSTGSASPSRIPCWGAVETGVVTLIGATTEILVRGDPGSCSPAASCMC